MAIGSTARSLRTFPTHRATPPFPTCSSSKRNKSCENDPVKTEAKFLVRRPRAIHRAVVFATLVFATMQLVAQTNGVDLLKLYPTTLTVGDTERGRPWKFAEADIFSVSKFKLNIGGKLQVETGPA